jgi:uncharacterized membrane protein YphA (DoxX/SURF4 family)
MAAKIAVVLLRLIVAVLFIAAGVLKIVDLHYTGASHSLVELLSLANYHFNGSATSLFFEDVMNFHLVPWDVAMVVAVYLPWLELIVGVALLTPWLRLGALAITGTLTLVFLGARGSAWSRGLDISCGCFGRENNATDFPVVITRDVALLAAVLFLLWWEGRKLRRTAANSTS